MIFYIGDYEIHANNHELIYKSCPKKIEPQVFKLLLYMLDNTDRVLSRGELMDNVWENRVISDSALSASICSARHAIGDNAQKQDCIKTVSGHGYRFIAKFTHKSPEANESQAFLSLAHQQSTSHHTDTSRGPVITKPNLSHSIPAPLLELPDKPSVAVMDFIDMGSTPKGSLFAYGLTTEINSSLARLPHFFVIARASASHLSKQDLPPNVVGERLGVRYLILGKTQHLNKQIQITLSIVDATHNNEIWSEHFNQSTDDLFQVHNEVVHSIVSVIDSTVEQAEVDRAFLKASENLSAWENYHQGIWHSNQTTLVHTKKAQLLFKKAIAQDPRFSRAYAGLSIIHTNKILLNNISNEDTNNMTQALNYAQRSISYGVRDTMSYFSLARVLWLSKEYERAIVATDKGLIVNENDLKCNFFKGFVSAFSGHDQQAHNLLEKAQRLNPYDPLQFSLKIARAISLIHQQKYDEAVDWAISATDDSNAYFSTYAVATASLELARHSKRAKQYAQQTLALKPDYSVKTYQYLTPHSDKATRVLIGNAMHQSGIPR